MLPLEPFLLEHAAVFPLVLGRVGGLMATAPVLGNQSAPLQVRGLLAVALTVLVLPTQVEHAVPFSGGGFSLADYGLKVVLEVVVGLLLGLGLTILISGVQVAGQVVSQVSGMTLGNVFNPALDDNVSLFGQLFYFVTLAAFVAIGGHRMAMDSLLGTFEWSPPGAAAFGEGYAAALIGLLSQSFELGLRAAAPMLIALFLATVVLGLISRTLPQINTVAVGFSVNALVTLAVMFVALGGVVWTFQAPVDDALALLVDAVKESGANR